MNQYGLRKRLSTVFATLKMATMLPARVTQRMCEPRHPDIKIRAVSTPHLSRQVFRMGSRLSRKALLLSFWQKSLEVRSGLYPFSFLCRKAPQKPAHICYRAKQRRIAADRTLFVTESKRPLRKRTESARDSPTSPYIHNSQYNTKAMFSLIRRFSSEDTEVNLTGDELQHGIPAPHKDGVHGVFNPTRHTASPFRPPPLDPIVLHGYKEGTPEDSRLLSHAVAEEIRNMVPERLRIVEDWNLVYGLEQDGASLSTLYQKCKEYEGQRVGFVLVVQDQEGGVCIFFLCFLFFYKLSFITGG